MAGFVKYLITTVGGILIGFGLGLIALQNTELVKSHYQAAMILSLVAGGFFLALGLPQKRRESVEREDQMTQQG